MGAFIQNQVTLYGLLISLCFTWGHTLQKYSPKCKRVQEMECMIQLSKSETFVNRPFFLIKYTADKKEYSKQSHILLENYLRKKLGPNMCTLHSLRFIRYFCCFSYISEAINVSYKFTDIPTLHMSHFTVEINAYTTKFLRSTVWCRVYLRKYLTLE